MGDDTDSEGYEWVGSDEELEATLDSVQIAETYQHWSKILERDYPGVSIRQYTVQESAERYYHSNLSSLVNDIKYLRDVTAATAINMRVRVLDIENGTETVRSLRLDVDDESLESVPAYVSSSAAPMFEGRGEYSGSDNVTGMIVEWDLGWIQLVSEVDDPNAVTTIVGTSTMFPGYKTKVVDSDNHGLAYSAGDCLFICLNEATGKRLDPVDVRSRLYSNVPEPKRGRVVLNIRTDLRRLATIYECRIMVHCVDDNVRIVSRGNVADAPTVRLVKMGYAIGLRDGVADAIAKTDELGDVAMAYYDLETVSSSDATQVYAFSTMWPNGVKVTLLHHDSQVMNRSIVATLSELLAVSPCKRVYMQAWNGSRFDHLILVGICSKTFSVGMTITNERREILSLTLSSEGKSIILRDPCKMFPCALSEACSIFNIEKGKLDIDHVAVEDMYLCERLEEYIEEHRQEIEAYVERDVDCLKCVTERLVDMYSASGVNYNACLSRSMASYMMWRNGMSKTLKDALGSVQYGYSHVLHFTQGDANMVEVRDEAIGGRVQAIRGEYKHATLLDFKSMYPSVATYKKYPCGDCCPISEYTKGEMCYVPDKLGLYRVRITEQSHPHIVPYRKNKHSPYDWCHNETFVKLVTSADVECLIEGGAKFEVLDGIVWNDQVGYFDVHMEELFSKRKSSNGHMSEHYKGMANSLTGALFQQLMREYSRAFRDRVEATTYIKMHHKYIQLIHEVELEDGQIMMYFYPKRMTKSEDVRAQEEICKGAIGDKPVILTMFIYAYARAKLWRMWRHIEGISSVLGNGADSNDLDSNEVSGNSARDATKSDAIGTVVYCDTDSLMVVANPLQVEGGPKRYSNVASRLRNHIGIEMGELEIVTYDSDAVVALPKVYAMRDKQGKERIRAKGISRKSKVVSISDTQEAKQLVTQLREHGWDSLRDTHNYMSRSSASTISYEHIRELTNGQVLVSFQWHFKKEDTGVSKKYTTKVTQL